MMPTSWAMRLAGLWAAYKWRDWLRKIAGDALVENYKIETNRGFTGDIVRDLRY